MPLLGFLPAVGFLGKTLFLAKIVFYQASLWTGTTFLFKRSKETGNVLYLLLACILCAATWTAAIVSLVGFSAWLRNTAGLE
jgi:hypothetical protein